MGPKVGAVQNPEQRRPTEQGHEKEVPDRSRAAYSQAIALLQLSKKWHQLENSWTDVHVLSALFDLYEYVLSILSCVSKNIHSSSVIDSDEDGQNQTKGGFSNENDTNVRKVSLMSF